jgi:hypothetical protein
MYDISIDISSFPLLISVSVSDAGILFRSMAGDAASNASQKFQPPEEKLSQIDAPAADNTWHDVPDLSKDSLKSQLNNIKPFGKSDLKEVAGDASQAAHPQGSRDPTDTAALAAQDQQNNQSSGVDATSGINAAASTLNNKIDQNMPETKNKTKEYNARTKNYLKGKMPKERREQTIWRLKKMVVEIQGHGDCT